MLNIEIKPIKGILFIRLSGILNYRSISKLNKEVINLLKKVGVKNLVFNLNELNYIDKIGERKLIKICNKKNIQSFICCNNDNILSKLLLKNILVITDELTAVNLINS